MGYCELQVTSNFSFLRGASHAEELFGQAKALGYEALGITDRNSLAGIVRAHVAAKEASLRLIVGVRLDLQDRLPMLLYPQDRAAYSRLCRLLTLGKGRAGKGQCHLSAADLEQAAEGLIAVMIPDEADNALEGQLGWLKRLFRDNAYLALTRRFRPREHQRLQGLYECAARRGVSPVATNDVLYHIPERRILQEVVTCIRERCTIDALGFKRERFADRFLKSPQEMARLFARYPEAIANSAKIADLCHFSLDELAYQYPQESEREGRTPQEALEQLTHAGAQWRYPDGVPDTVAANLRHELQLIDELNYAPYFLTVYAIVRFARSRGILCQGRGSAANSAICFVLGITSIDPATSDLLFERFISAERGEPPDIDVDFEHERREEVIQWIYATYGRERAALAATVIRYRARGAIREVGKVMGLSEDVTGALSQLTWAWNEDGAGQSQARELNLNLDDRRLQLTFALAQELIGFPRHLSQHPGGFVLTRDRLDDLVPIEPAAMADRQVVEWDKDDLEALHMMKVDVLGLGMLGCMRRAFDFLRDHKALDLDLATIPPEDAPTYAMIQRADTIGTFQIESRAQMSMLPRLKPKTFYDLVIEVAIVRPGPIQGDMVHPYLRRREGKERISFPTPELERVLGKTLGVPLFQEQAMRVAIVCAGFTPSEADALRRSMATFKFSGGVSRFQGKLITGMVANGYDADFAARTFKQIEGFGSYGFPESHAASFALIAYASCWMKQHHPDVFCAALLNAQPMGFYAPAQIVRDARDHGVEVRPIDVNHSRWDCTLEATSKDRHAVRLGLRMARSLSNAQGAALIAARGDAPFADLEEMHRRSALAISALEQLAAADAFGSMALTRRAALWAIRALDKETLPLFAAADHIQREPEVTLPAMTQGAQVVEDYRQTGLTLRAHPVSFLRAELARRAIVPAAALQQMRDGQYVQVAGLILVRQRPGSAKGVMFITLEDETGIANLILWPKRFEAQRKVVLTSSMLGCRGKLQREGDVIHIVSERLFDCSGLLRRLGTLDHAFPLGFGRGDEATHAPGNDPRDKAKPGVKPRDIYIRDLRYDQPLPVKSRNFR